MGAVLDWRKVLAGVTRPGTGVTILRTDSSRYDGQVLPKSITNPGHHSPFVAQNRCRWELYGPDGKLKQSGEQVGNVMNTFGLDSMAQMIGSGAAVTASKIVSAARIGTGSTAAASTDTSLVASTASVVITAASMTNTYPGARTLEYRMTFASNNPAGAASIQEVALYCDSTATANNLFARLVLTGANSVNKGASDSIAMSYDIIFTTA